MSVDIQILLLILACGLVTFIPRVVPFVVAKKIPFPAPVIKWLSFIPVCILTALVVDSFITEGNQTLNIDWDVLIVIIPTLIIALWTKSLSITVIAGVVLMAVVRAFL